MRITLVHPPTISCVTTMVQEAVPPLGLAYVAAAARAAGHEVQVVDAVGEAVETHTLYSVADRLLLRGLPFDAIVARIPADAEVIGVSCMFSDAWCPTRDLLGAIRAAHPDAVIVLGGEHATALPQFVLETCAAVDYVVLGEGEARFVELLDTLDRGEVPVDGPGLATRRGGATVGRLRTRARGRAVTRIDDLGQIPRPAWDLFPLEAYIAGGYNHGLRRGRSMPILTSRGCPYQCTFCSSPRMWTTKWAPREVADVVDEMRGYVERYGVNDFTFYDLTAIVRREWILSLCEAIERAGLDVTWQLPSGTRSEAVDDEVAAALYRAGCRNLNFAPESGSPFVLDRIRKRVKLDRMERAIAVATRAGIDVKVNIILGFPFEGPSELLETAAFVRRVAALGAEAVSVFPFCCYPGSSLFEELRRDGTIELTDAYFSRLVFTDYGRIVSYSRYFSPRQLEAAVLAMNAVFYGSQALMRPGRLASALSQVVRREQSGKVSNAIEPMRKRQEAYSRLVREGAPSTR